MHPITRICHAVLMLVLSTTAHANTATEIFESDPERSLVYGKRYQGKPISQGSGVVLPGGAVVTNCHVIDDAPLGGQASAAGIPRHAQTRRP